MKWTTGLVDPHHASHFRPRAWLRWVGLGLTGIMFMLIFPFVLVIALIHHILFEEYKS